MERRRNDDERHDAWQRRRDGATSALLRSRSSDERFRHTRHERTGQDYCWTATSRRKKTASDSTTASFLQSSDERFRHAQHGRTGQDGSWTATNRLKKTASDDSTTASCFSPTIDGLTLTVVRKRYPNIYGCGSRSMKHIFIETLDDRSLQLAKHDCNGLSWLAPDDGDGHACDQTTYNR